MTGDMLRPAATCVTWCQPRGLDDPDVVLIDGDVIDPACEAIRRAAVSRAADVMRRAPRALLPGGGTMAASGREWAFEVPVRTDDSTLTSAVGVYLRSLDPVVLVNAASQIAVTAELAGFTTDPAVVEGVLGAASQALVRPRAGRSGRLARLWGGIKAFFGRVFHGR